MLFDSAPLLHENSSSAVLPSIFRSPQPYFDSSLATPRAFADTSNLVETPSKIFGKFDPLAATNTPFANRNISPIAPACSPTPTRQRFQSNTIPLTFSAANTPIAPPAESPMVDQCESRTMMSLGECGTPNPATMASFFRQRSAHLSSPIFRQTARAAPANLPSSPLVRANPLANSEIAAAALPETITPLHVADINFSLVSGFNESPNGISLDLGTRAARIPIPYVIRLRFVDISGTIRPIAARLERLLGEPQSMFISVINTSSDSCPNPSALTDFASQDEPSVMEGVTCAFWAAPDALMTSGCGSLMLTVTDEEYRDHEVSINISARSTKPRITIDAPGYFHRQVRSETSVSFSGQGLDGDALITVWNETDGDAPLFLNIVLHEDSGGAFQIGDETGHFSECIPILLHAGCSYTFWTRFTQRPDLTVRHCYYGSVLIKYALAVQAHTPPGHDLELHQYYDHVLSLVAALGSGDMMHETVATPCLHESFHDSPYNSVVDNCDRSGSKNHAAASLPDPISSPSEDVYEDMSETRLPESVVSVHADSHSRSNGDPDDLNISANDSNPQSSEEVVNALKGLAEENQQAELGGYGTESSLGSGLLAQDAVFDSAKDEIRSDVGNQTRQQTYAMRYTCSSQLDDYHEIQGKVENEISCTSSRNIYQNGGQSHLLPKAVSCTSLTEQMGKFDYSFEDQQSMRRKSENSGIEHQDDVQIGGFLHFNSQPLGFQVPESSGLSDSFTILAQDNTLVDKIVELAGSSEPHSTTQHPGGQEKSCKSEILNIAGERINDKSGNVIDGDTWAEGHVQCSEDFDISESHLVEPGAGSVSLSNCEISTGDESEAHEVIQKVSVDHMMFGVNGKVEQTKSEVYDIHVSHGTDKSESLEAINFSTRNETCADQEALVQSLKSSRMEELYVPMENSCSTSMQSVDSEKDNEAVKPGPNNQDGEQQHQTGSDGGVFPKKYIVQSEQNYLQEGLKKLVTDNDNQLNGGKGNQNDTAFSADNRQAPCESGFCPNEISAPEKYELRSEFTEERKSLDEKESKFSKRKENNVEQSLLVSFGNRSRYQSDMQPLSTSSTSICGTNEEIHLTGTKEPELSLEGIQTKEQQLLDLHRKEDQQFKCDSDTKNREKHVREGDHADIPGSCEKRLMLSDKPNDQDIAAEALASLRYAINSYSLNPHDSVERKCLLHREVSPWKNMAMTDKQMNVEAGKSYTGEQSKSKIGSCEDGGIAFSGHECEDLLMVNKTSMPGLAHTENRAEYQNPFTNVSAGRPKLKMPRNIREGGVVMNPNQGYVELPVLNASAEVVEVSVTVESMRERDHDQGSDVSTTVTPNYVVIGASEQARLTMMRTSSAPAESFIVLRAATMGLNAMRMNYRIPVHIAKSVMRVEACSEFAVDRPTMSFYNPSRKSREWQVRLRNGTAQPAPYRVWIGEGCGNLHSSNGDPAFQVIGPTSGIVKSEEYATIRVCYEGKDAVQHFHGRLNVLVGEQTDFMPLFGYSGASDVRLCTNELGYVCARNVGNRFGFIVITGPESNASQNSNVKAVLAPGEEREFVAPYGSGSVIYTGDEIARSRERRAEELRCLGEDDSHGSDDSCELFRGEFEGEDAACDVEGLDWWAEDKFSMFYSGRLLDHNTKRYVFSLKDGETALLVQTDSPSRHGWTASVTDGFVHIENLEAEQEIYFETDGAEPKYGVIAPLGNAMLAAFRENVEIRALGRIETLHVELPTQG